MGAANPCTTAPLFRTIRTHLAAARAHDGLPGSFALGHGWALWGLLAFGALVPWSVLAEEDAAIKARSSVTSSISARSN